MKTTVITALTLRLFCGSTRCSSLCRNGRKCGSFFLAKVGFVFFDGEHIKGAGFLKIPVFYCFLNAGENTTVKCRFKAILSVKQFCTDRCGCICLRNILNRM